jgi:hypothetical protein
VVAADAAEPERTGPAAGLDVGGLVAGALGHRDLTDGPTGVLGVEQGLGLPPDVLAVAVELVAGDLVDRVALPLGTDAVVNPRGVHRVVIEQLPQHVDRDSGVGVPLGVGMTCLRRDRVRSGSCCV